MTFRCIWTEPDGWAPLFADYDDEHDAHLRALRVSRELGIEVAVVEVDR